MIIEPCCCHKQLSPLCKDNKHRLTAFHTNGDVTVEKVFAATAYLVGPCKMTLITPCLDSNLSQYLNHCFMRGWITSLNLLTTQSEPRNVLQDKSVTWLNDNRITESSSMFILEGQSYRLCITGYLPPSPPADTDNKYRLVNHILLYCDNTEDALWNELTKIPTAPFRICLTKKTLIS